MNYLKLRGKLNRIIGNLTSVAVTPRGLSLRYSILMYKRPSITLFLNFLRFSMTKQVSFSNRSGTGVFMNGPVEFDPED